MKVELVVAMYAGSQLYGTSTPQSDVDIRGVCMPTMESVIGMSPFEQFNPGKEQAKKWSLEKLGVEADDVTIYALPKFFGLLMAANPNIVELVFAPEQAILYKTPLWDEIVANRHLFLSQKVVHTFAGYAYAQLQRIQRHKRWLDNPVEKPNPEDYMGQFVDGTWVWREPTKEEIIELDRVSKEHADFVDDLDDLYRRAARKKEYEADMREWQHYQTWRKERNPARSKLEEKYHYDTKHAMHLYRLSIEADQLLMTGEIKLPFSDNIVQSLRRVLNGEIEYETVVQFATQIDSVLDKRRHVTKLPYAPDKKGVEKFLMRILKDFVCAYES